MQRECFLTNEMIDDTFIAQILQDLENKYVGKSLTLQEPMYYSKLALIELCGWIEESMDAIIENCARNYLTETANRKFVVNEIIRKTYSFSYERHFRPMLMKVIGMVKVEELEGQIDCQNFDLMKSSLGTLMQERNLLAHTFIVGTTPRLGGPSVIIQHLSHVSTGLRDIENYICTMNL